MRGYSIVHIGNHEVVHIVDVRAIEAQRDEWRRCAEMLHEALNPPTEPSGECIGDQRRDAEELFARLKSGQPVASELSEAKEYARKLSIKVTDQGVDIQRLKGELEIAAKISDVCKRQEVELQHLRNACHESDKANVDLMERGVASGFEIEHLKRQLQRKQDAGDLLFEELDDITPDGICECIPHGWKCASCLLDDARKALKAWKEENK